MAVSTVEPLGPAHVSALRTMLSQDPAHNMYLLGLMEEFGVVSDPTRAPFTFWGRFVGTELQACLFVGGGGGLVVPSAGTTRDINDFGKHLAGKVQLKSCIGEAKLVDALLTHLAAGQPVPHARLQRLHAVSADDMGPFTNPLLRLATEADLPRLVPLAAAGVKEMLARDPLKEDPEGFPQRVRQRVVARRTYVLEENGRLVFKLDVGSRSQFGAELEGLYTIPEERKKGHATLCLGQISRFLLSSLPRLTLRIDEDNQSLANVARKVGYLAKRPQKIVWLA